MEEEGVRSHAPLICSSQDELRILQRKKKVERHALVRKTEKGGEKENVGEKCCVGVGISIHLVYNPPLSKSPSLLHHGPLGRTSKGGDEGGEAARRDRVNDREEEEKKAAESGGEEGTLRHQESLSKMFFIGLQRCVITKMTADDNSGQLMDLSPICCSIDRNEI